MPQDDISPSQQFQLPESFFTDWPFDVGQGEAFDFLSDFQANGAGLMSNGNGNGLEGGQGQHQNQNQNQGDGGVGSGGGIQDILGVGMPEGFVGAGQIGGVLGSMGFTSGS